MTVSGRGRLTLRWLRMREGGLLNGLQVLSHPAEYFADKLNTEVESFFAANGSNIIRIYTPGTVKDFFTMSGYIATPHHRHLPTPLSPDLYITVLDSDLYAHIIYHIKQSQHLNRSESEFSDSDFDPCCSQEAFIQ